MSEGKKNCKMLQVKGGVEEDKGVEYRVQNRGRIRVRMIQRLEMEDQILEMEDQRLEMEDQRPEQIILETFLWRS